MRIGPYTKVLPYFLYIYTGIDIYIYIYNNNNHFIKQKEIWDLCYIANSQQLF